MNRPSCLTLTLVLLSLLESMGYDRPTERPFLASRSEVVAKHGMAATSHPLATQIAIDILKQGGNAIDAAIAANAALGLMEPMSCGIGGDLFAIVWHAESGKLFGLNGSGRSPRSLTIDVFRERNLDKIPKFGPLPVSVPGCVDGWFALHGRYGKLPMNTILEPAIRYAREGFPVSEVIAHDWSGGAKTLRDYAGFSETFLIDGRAPRKGEIFRNPWLGDTLELIAKEGRDAFYQGATARTIADFMQKQGGFLSYEDLASHHSTWVDPVSTNYRGYDLWELPPNGQGIAALQMLNVLEGFDLRSFGFGRVEHVHALVEAKKLAFADRAKYYADPAFHRLPVENLISKAYAETRRALIDPNAAAKSVDAGNPVLEEGDTIYLTVADRARNMVSFIQSNFRGFGSGLCPDQLGFGLQNRGELFTLEEGHFNAYAPGKRPFHTIIPAFVTKDGKPYLSFGVMGGATQPQGHVQILVNHIDFGMNFQEAGDAPRVVHTGSSEPTGEVMEDGGKVHMESGFPEATREAMKAKGHQLAPAPGVYGGYQAIHYDAENDVYFGASESRKDGQAAGY